MHDVTKQVYAEVQHVLETTSDEMNFNYLSTVMDQAKRIFIAGEGRSGLVGKMIAMRLMHSGYSVYVQGETITPSIEENDLLIVLSGSGSTDSLVNAAVTAKKSGASLLCFTTDMHSKLAEICENTVHVKAATKHRKEGEPATIQPLGNQFDQSLHLLLDSLIIYAISRNQISYDDMNKKHANLE